MAVSAKARKLLWGRAANRCSICRRELVLPPIGRYGGSIIGHECHIEASSANGPRGTGRSGSDSYDNLILLCSEDHKRIDDRPGEYPPERLTAIKQRHEARVRSMLEEAATPQFKIVRAADGRVRGTLVTTGEQLFGIIDRAQGYDFGCDDGSDISQTEFIAGFLQELQEMTDLSDEIDLGERVRLQNRWTDDIRTLCNFGFAVAGVREACVL